MIDAAGHFAKLWQSVSSSGKMRVFKFSKRSGWSQDRLRMVSGWPQDWIRMDSGLRLSDVGGCLRSAAGVQAGLALAKRFDRSLMAEIFFCARDTRRFPAENGMCLSRNCLKTGIESA
jgi:hypothetical protein